MSDQQYWAWFWKNITIWLPVEIPIIIGAFIFGIAKLWSEWHEGGR